MIKRMLGPTGLTGSALGLGCNTSGMRRDLDKKRALAAVEVGINFVDTE
jgi:aryl-alcohol dehydrogenase-like predicted oxidoreductase